MEHIESKIYSSPLQSSVSPHKLKTNTSKQKTRPHRDGSHSATRSRLDVLFVPAHLLASRHHPHHGGSRSGGPSEPTRRGGGMVGGVRGVRYERQLWSQSGMGAGGEVRPFASGVHSRHTSSLSHDTRHTRARAGGRGGRHMCTSIYAARPGTRLTDSRAVLTTTAHPSFLLCLSLSLSAWKKKTKPKTKTKTKKMNE